MTVALLGLTAGLLLWGSSHAHCRGLYFLCDTLLLLALIPTALAVLVQVLK